MEENKRISDLFERARTEAPKTSFDEVKKHVLAASAVGATGIIAKFLAASFKFKAIIMLGIVSTLTVSGLLIFSQVGDGALRGHFDSAQRTPQGTDAMSDENQNYEMLTENGVQKTIVFDENNKVVKVIVDSSDEAQDAKEKVKLTTKKPESVSKSNNRLDPSVTFKESPSGKADPEDSLTMKKFKITEKTHVDELGKISEQAKAAGVEFDYNARVRKNKIKKMKMDMKINSGDGCNEWCAKISGSKSFSYEFGWWEDDSGKAVKFLSSERICKALESLDALESLKGLEGLEEVED